LTLWEIAIIGWLILYIFWKQDEEIKRKTNKKKIPASGIEWLVVSGIPPPA